MLGYHLKYISFDHMILDMPYPSYEIVEFLVLDDSENYIKDPYQDEEGI